MGLLGMLSGEALAEEAKSKYDAMSRPALTKTLQEKAVVLTEANFEKEVINYDGAVLVLFDSTCNKTQEADIMDRNMDIVYLRLIDQFKAAEVNNVPLKFAYFDGCGSYGREFFSTIDVTSLETHMYLDGTKIDVKKGGPKDPTKTEGNTQAMSAWVDSTLLGNTRISDDGKPYRWGYENTSEIHKIFFDQ